MRRASRAASTAAVCGWSLPGRASTPRAPPPGRHGSRARDPLACRAVNGTLWNPAAPLWPGLRAAALVMLCLWAGPVLGETAPPADAPPNSAAAAPNNPAQEVAAKGPEAPPAAAAPEPRKDAAATPLSHPAGGTADAVEADGPVAEASAATAARPNPVAAATEGAIDPAGRTATGTSPIEDALSSAERAADADLSDVPAWRPDVLEAEGEDDVGASAGAMLLRTVLVLGVVLAAIYLTLNVGLRRLMGLSAVGGRGNNALLQVVERHPVGPRHALLVVRAGDDHLVVSQSEGQMNLISRIEPAQVAAHAAAKAEAPPSAPILSPFLQKLLARRGEPVQSPEPAPPPPSTPPSV